MYVKLFGSILDSSIWSADLATRVVWITLLTMADEYGIVYASVDGLANRARVSVADCRKALRILLSGDRNSRTKNDRGTKLEGRRIEALEGGWQVINYQKYRELRSRRQIADAARQARHRQKSVTTRDSAVTGVTRHDVTVEAEAEAEAEAERTSSALRAAQEAGPPAAPTTAASPKETWLTAFGDLWTRTYGGAPAYGELGKHLKPLLEGRAVGEVLDHWGRYLAETAPEYVSPARFAQTFGRWGKEARTPADTRPDMYLTLEEQDARRAKARGNGTDGLTHVRDSISLP